MLDVAGCVLARELGLDPDRRLRVGACQLPDLAVERRREEHRLAVARQPFHDSVDLWLEAHVEHPVGLVEDEDLHGVERDQPSVEQVLEAAGRGHDDVRETRDVRLLAECDTAVHGCHAEVAGGRERLDLLGHLDGELARRDEHERGWTCVVVRRPLDERDREGEGLARARRRLREEVRARERGRDGPRLDLKRAVDAARFEHRGQFCAHAERSECVLRHVTPVLS